MAYLLNKFTYIVAKYMYILKTFRKKKVNMPTKERSLRKVHKIDEILLWRACRLLVSCDDSFGNTEVLLLSHEE